jgi:predicted N-acetyltransferase YhbS
VFVYDRITTVPEHQHQGLGAAIMAALGTAQQSQAAQRVLVATEAGRGLYSTIGWSVHSHFTVAITPPFDELRLQAHGAKAVDLQSIS